MQKRIKISDRTEKRHVRGEGREQSGLYIGLTSASPTACRLRGYRLAGTHNKALGEGFPTVRSAWPAHDCARVYMPIRLLPVVVANQEKISDNLENKGMSEVKKGNDEERKATVERVDGEKEVKEGKKEIELGKQEGDEAMVEKGEAEHKKGLVAEAKGRMDKANGEEEVIQLDDRHTF